MTKEQQDSGKLLDLAEVRYLRAYGWELADKHWKHSGVAGSYLARDAVAITKANPSLGWSVLRRNQ